VLPSVQEDAVSVLTYDPNMQQAFDDEEQLEQKEEELKQLQRLYDVQTIKLQAAEASLSKIELSYKQEAREWKLSMEELQSQKTILEERLDVMEDDIHNAELMEKLANLITKDAPKELTENGDMEDDDDAASRDTASSFPLRLGSRKSSSRNQQHMAQRLEQRVQSLEEYITQLQARLTEAMHSMVALTNQIQILGETHEHQTSKLRAQLKSSEKERIYQEIEYRDGLHRIKEDKLVLEQKLLAKLEAKTERVDRLEELVDELREVASRDPQSKADYENAVAIQNLKEQFDTLSIEKDTMAQRHYDEIDEMQKEIKLLRTQNESLEYQISTLKPIGDAGANEISSGKGFNGNSSCVAENRAYSVGSTGQQNDISGRNRLPETETEDFPSLHVEKLKRIQAHDFRKLSNNLQENKYAEMDEMTRSKTQARVSRFL
jgi:chromosome segregation ATPase